MKRKSIYTGELNKPIKLSALKALAASLRGNNNPYDDQIFAERSQKMKLLLEHYKIDENEQQRWLLLALFMATDHVRGFQTIFPGDNKKKGRQTFWNNQKQIDLVSDVENYQPRSGSRRTKSLKITEACRFLLTQEPYKSIRVKGKPISAATLARQYNLAKTKQKKRQSALSINPHIEQPFGVSPETYAAIIGRK